MKCWLFSLVKQQLAAFPRWGLNQHHRLVKCSHRNDHLLCLPFSLPYILQNQIRWQVSAPRSDCFRPRRLQVVVKTARGSSAASRRDRHWRPGPATGPGARAANCWARRSPSWLKRTNSLLRTCGKSPATAVSFPVFQTYQRKLSIWFRYSFLSLNEQHVYFHLLSQPVSPLVLPDSSSRKYEENQASALKGLNAVFHPHVLNKPSEELNNCPVMFRGMLHLQPNISAVSSLSSSSTTSSDSHFGSGCGIDLFWSHLC